MRISVHIQHRTSIALPENHPFVKIEYENPEKKLDIKINTSSSPPLLPKSPAAEFRDWSLNTDEKRKRPERTHSRAAPEKVDVILDEIA